MFYTYEKDCENANCEECERKNYCEYYLNSDEDDELDENEEKTQDFSEPLSKEVTETKNEDVKTMREKTKKNK